MSLNKFLQTYLYSEVDNKVTITAAADSSGSLAGTYFTFPAVDKSGNAFQIAPWFKVSGVGSNPISGTKAKDTITFPADTAGNYQSTYFFINDGLSTNFNKYYVWFNEGGTGVDPGKGVQNASTVAIAADVAGSLAGEYFKVYTPTNSFYVWFYVEGASNTDPAPAGLGGIMVRIWPNSTIATINAAIQVALNQAAPGQFTFSFATPTLTITNVAYGAVTATADGSTGWSISNTVSGANAKIFGYTSLFASGVVVGSGNTGTQVGQAVKTAFNGLSGWSASGAAAIIAITHPNVGNPPPALNGTVPAGFSNAATAGTELYLGAPSRTSDAITMPADTAGNYVQTYFLVYDGPSTNSTPYYVYYTESGYLTDPKVGVKEVQTITTTADTTGSLDGKYLTWFDSSGQEYYVWFYESTGTDPAVASSKGAKAVIAANATSAQVAQALYQAMIGVGAGMFTFAITANKITLSSVAAGTMTAAADTGSTGFTFAVTTTGVAPVAALANVNSLVPGGILIASGNTGTQIATASAAAILSLAPGWEATSSGTTLTLLHKNPGNCTATANGTIPAGFSVTPTAGSDATVVAPYPIEVDIVTNATANAVASALRTALSTGGLNSGLINATNTSQQYKSSFNYMFVVTGATNQCIMTSRWPWPSSAPTAAADGATGYTTGFTVTTTTTGTATLTNNMISSATTNVFKYAPDGDKILYLRKIEFGFTAGTTAVTRGDYFGTATAALTNGIQVSLVQVNANGGTVTTLLNLTPVILDNIELMALGRSIVNAGGMVVEYNLTEGFGSTYKFEVPVYGALNQEIRIAPTDNLSGNGTELICRIYGHLAEPGDVYDSFGNLVSL